MNEDIAATRLLALQLQQGQISSQVTRNAEDVQGLMELQREDHSSTRSLLAWRDTDRARTDVLASKVDQLTKDVTGLQARVATKADISAATDELKAKIDSIVDAAHKSEVESVRTVTKLDTKQVAVYGVMAAAIAAIVAALTKALLTTTG